MQHMQYMQHLQYMRHFFFARAKENCFGSAALIEFPDWPPELGCPIWLKSCLSPRGRTRRLGLRRPWRPEMEPAGPKWPQTDQIMVQDRQKLCPQRFIDSVVKPMENEEFSSKRYSIVSLEIPKWVQKPYKTNGKRAFDQKKNMQLCRFSCKTNGKWRNLVEWHENICKINQIPL